MTIDIRDDLPAFKRYISQRVGEHLESAEAAKPIYRIDFGFEFGQANWVAMVFDTRHNASADGHWTLKLDEILCRRPAWPVWYELPPHERVQFIELDGRHSDLMENPDMIGCRIIGEALKHTLLWAKEHGVFNPLKRAARCEMNVENLEGYYSWPAYQESTTANLL